MVYESSRPGDVSGGVYIETYGCQMNLVDSEIVMAMLEERGYHRAETPEAAQLILVNTCAVREHAENRVIQRIRRFQPLREADSTRRVGVLGCLSRHAADELSRELPFVDWIMGPDVYRRLPGMLAEGDGEVPLVLPNGPADELYDDVLPSRREGVNAWVTITRGCNNHCTYCVVPAVRGEERHRPAMSILHEVEQAVEQGHVQITLLGQNVNSYRHEGADFASLLRQVARVPGLKRLRFITSHPKDLSDRLLDVMAAENVICPELHLPLQAGSDRILKRMNRRYTAEHYMELARKARRRVPDLLLSTDIIVGFPGETHEEYLGTRRIVREIGYDDAFVYKYSERPNTPAAKLEDDVPESEKVRRLMEINDIVRESGVARRREQIGRTLPVLIEGPSTRDPEEMMGRTPAGHVVVVPTHAAAGDEIMVTIEELAGYTLRGAEKVGAVRENLATQS